LHVTLACLVLLFSAVQEETGSAQQLRLHHYHRQYNSELSQIHTD